MLRPASSGSAVGGYGKSSPQTNAKITVTNPDRGARPLPAPRPVPSFKTKNHNREYTRLLDEAGFLHQRSGDAREAIVSQALAALVKSELPSATQPDRARRVAAALMEALPLDSRSPAMRSACEVFASSLVDALHVLKVSSVNVSWNAGENPTYSFDEGRHEVSLSIPDIRARAERLSGTDAESGKARQDLVTRGAWAAFEAYAVEEYPELDDLLTLGPGTTFRYRGNPLEGASEEFRTALREDDSRLSPRRPRAQGINFTAVEQGGARTPPLLV